MFDCFLSFYGVRLNTFASLLLNQDSHVTNITVLIVVYIGDLGSMLLCGNILHHNHVFIPIVHQKGLTLVQALRGRVGAKGCWRIFFKNPTTQLRVVWGLTEKKCEQTPKFACFSV